MLIYCPLVNACSALVINMITELNYKHVERVKRETLSTVLQVLSRLVLVAVLEAFKNQCLRFDYKIKTPHTVWRLNLILHPITLLAGMEICVSFDAICVSFDTQTLWTIEDFLLIHRLFLPYSGILHTLVKCTAEFNEVHVSGRPKSST